MTRPEPELILPCPAPDRENRENDPQPAPASVPETDAENAPSDPVGNDVQPEGDEHAAESDPSDPAPEDPPGSLCSSVRPVLSGLRVALPWALSCFAALIFAASAVTALASADLSREKIVRILLDSVFGGGDSVTVSYPGDSPEAYPAPAGGPTDSLLLPPDGAFPVPAPSDEAEQTVPDPDHIPADDENRIPEPAGSPSSFRLTNETGYDPDPDTLLALPRAVPPLPDLQMIWGEDAPLVLILHTHGTEAYAECADGNWRSTDPSLSVVSLGEVLADRLREAGIPAIHLTSLFDTPDFNLSYYNAAEAIRETLALHPSVSYILDLHRDSMLLPDGTVCAPVTEIEGRRAAQLMFVVGTDEAGAEHPGWRDNLSLALRLQSALSGSCPTLMRDINLRSASFNEQYTKGSLLVEIGASGCTHAEAETAVLLLSEALIGEIRGD